MTVMKKKLAEYEKENSNPNTPKGTSSVSLKYEAVCLVDEDNFEIIIKDSDKDLETHSKKVFASKSF
jgi:hypothetical protein